MFMLQIFSWSIQLLLYNIVVLFSRWSSHAALYSMWYTVLFFSTRINPISVVQQISAGVLMCSRSLQTVRSFIRMAAIRLYTMVCLNVLRRASVLKYPAEAISYNLPNDLNYQYEPYAC